eukprot:9241486-Alexandrium_andersonii.AAC.1
MLPPRWPVPHSAKCLSKLSLENLYAMGTRHVQIVSEPLEQIDRETVRDIREQFPSECFTGVIRRQGTRPNAASWRPTKARRCASDHSEVARISHRGGLHIAQRKTD